MVVSTCHCIASYHHLSIDHSSFKCHMIPSSTRMYFASHSTMTIASIHRIILHLQHRLNHPSSQFVSSTFFLIEDFRPSLVTISTYILHINLWCGFFTPHNNRHLYGSLFFHTSPLLQYIKDILSLGFFYYRWCVVVLWKCF